MALRQTLELQLGARVLPTMVSVPAAHDAFDASGTPVSFPLVQLSRRLVAQLLEAVAPMRD